MPEEEGEVAEKSIRGRPIVIDNGSKKIRAGFAGEGAPTAVFPSIVGKAVPWKKTESDAEDGLSEDHSDLEGPFVGDEAFKRRQKDVYTSPIHDGVISNWEDLETIWRYTFVNKLEVRVEEHPVLLIEPPMSPKATRQRMTQLIFETFDAPAVCITSQAVMALFAAGAMTGVVLDSGSGLSSAVPVYALYPIPHAIRTRPLAGRHVVQHLSNLLMDRGLTFELHHHTKRNVTRAVQAKIRQKNSLAGAPKEDVADRPWATRERRTDDQEGGVVGQRSTLRSQKSAQSLRSLRSLRSQGSLQTLPDGSKVPKQAVPMRTLLESSGLITTVSRKGTQARKSVARKEIGGDSQLPEAIAEIIRRIKEQAAYVALDFDAEVKKARQGKDLEMTCDLLGRDKITLNEERFRCAEALFEPYVLVKEGIQTTGLQHAIAEAVAQCDADIRQEIWSEVVLCGGNMMLGGVAERMDKELRAMLPETSKLKVSRAEDCINSAWRGGAMFAALEEGFQRACIMRAEFDESGPGLSASRFA